MDRIPIARTKRGTTYRRDPRTTLRSGLPPSGSATNFFEVPRQLTVRAPGESATGQSRPESHQFAFDRVFGPSSTQEDIFADVADLTQSAIDGFNVCVFAYGQTGSGKSVRCDSSYPLVGDADKDLLVHDGRWSYADYPRSHPACSRRAFRDCRGSKGPGVGVGV